MPRYSYATIIPMHRRFERLLTTWHRIGSYFEKRTEWYERAFAIEEIRTNIRLQLYMGASLLVFFLVFFTWGFGSTITIEDATLGESICWPYAQGCDALFFFHELNIDYTQSVFYMALYSILVLIAWSMFRAKWRLAHALLFIPLIWESLVTLVLSYPISAPYYYYHIILTAALLLATHKEFFIKALFVLLYFLSATIKFDAGWILGTYFTTLKTGLPLFPDNLTPFFTNLVIGMQVVGSWFLLSTKRILQRGAFVFFTLFHLYSGVLVLFYYVTVALPPLLIFFGPLYRHTPIPFSKKAITGWFLIGLLLLFQFSGFLISSGDRRLSGEGNRYGMFMFDANHQCVMQARVHLTTSVAEETTLHTTQPGTQCRRMYCLISSTLSPDRSTSVRTDRFESGAALYRCDPYEWWARYKQLCEHDSRVWNVEFTMDHSINGGPFYRIIQTTDFCSLEYKPFSHNTWIKLPPEAPTVGRPVQNTYRY